MVFAWSRRREDLSMLTPLYYPCGEVYFYHCPVIVVGVHGRRVPIKHWYQREHCCEYWRGGQPIPFSERRIISWCYPRMHVKQDLAVNWGEKFSNVGFDYSSRVRCNIFLCVECICFFKEQLEFRNHVRSSVFWKTSLRNSRVCVGAMVAWFVKNCDQFWFVNGRYQGCWRDRSV